MSYIQQRVDSSLHYAAHIICGTRKGCPLLLTGVQGVSYDQAHKVERNKTQDLWWRQSEGLNPGLSNHIYIYAQRYPRFSSNHQVTAGGLFLGLGGGKYGEEAYDDDCICHGV